VHALASVAQDTRCVGSAAGTDVAVALTPAASDALPKTMSAAIAIADDRIAAQAMTLRTPLR